MSSNLGKQSSDQASEGATHCARFGLDPAQSRFVTRFKSAIMYSLLPHQGHTYIFDTHLCFYSKNLAQLNKEYKEIVPWTAVNDLKQKNTAVVVPNAISVELTGRDDLFLTSFLSRNQAFECMQHFFTAAQVPLRIRSSVRHSLVPLNAAMGAKADGMSADDARRFLLEEERAKKAGKMNEGNARMAEVNRRTQGIVATAEATRDLGANVMVDLQSQSEQLDRIGRDMDKMDVHLENSDRVLKNMERNFFVDAATGFSGPSLAKYDVGDADEAGPSAAAGPSGETVTLPVIRVNNMNKYQGREYTFRDGDKQFHRLNPYGKDSSQDRASFPIDAVAGIDILYGFLVIRFDPSSGCKDQYVVSVHERILVEEILGRQSAGHHALVVFHDKARSWDYLRGNELYTAGRKREDGSRATVAAETQSSALFKSKKTSKFLKHTDSSSALKAGGSAGEHDVQDPDSYVNQKQLDQQMQANDQLVEQVGVVVGDLKTMAVSMGQEIAGQTEKVDKLDRRMDDTTDKLKRDQKRMQKLM